MNFPLLTEYVGFVNARHTAHLNRSAGRPAPWSDDPIIQQYRFCNMRREDDRVTKWIHTNWLREDPQAWFAMYIARVFNNPATLEAVGYPTPWTPARYKRIVDICSKRQNDGIKIFNPAYRVVSAAHTGPTLLTYTKIFDEVWAERKTINLAKTTSLQTLVGQLLKFEGLGTFLAAQVIADIKWLPSLRGVEDWYTFASSGPGSRRGLNRLVGNPVEQSWREPDWHATLLELRKQALPKFHNDLRKLDAQNLQNTLCESDKFFRVKFGEGTPKQLFKVNAEPYV